MLILKQQRLARGLRWTARIIGLGASIYFLLFFIILGEIISIVEGNPLPWETKSILMSIFFVIGLVGCIISWWRERLAGILLILVATAFAILIWLLGSGVIIVTIPETNKVESWSMSEWPIYGLHYLIAGVFFLLSWRLTRKTS